MLSDPLLLYPNCFHDIPEGSENATTPESVPVAAYVTTGFQNSTVTKERVGWRAEMGLNPVVEPTHLPTTVVTSQQVVGKNENRRGRTLVELKHPRKTSEGYDPSQFNKLYVVGDIYDGDQSDCVKSMVESLVYILSGIRANGTKSVDDLMNIGSAGWPPTTGGGVTNIDGFGFEGYNQATSFRLFITREF